jgi:hypothetical protein
VTAMRARGRQRGSAVAATCGDDGATCGPELSRAAKGGLKITGLTVQPHAPTSDSSD